jgi:hypothetical protein
MKRDERAQAWSSEALILDALRQLIQSEHLACESPAERLTRRPTPHRMGAAYSLTERVAQITKSERGDCDSNAANTTGGIR